MLTRAVNIFSDVFSMLPYLYNSLQQQLTKQSSVFPSPKSSESGCHSSKSSASFQSSFSGFSLLFPAVRPTPILFTYRSILIKPVIRAIYSSKNQQLITCTVSMIETAIAVIAACLPVLRTLFFGPRSRSGTSNSRAYELSFGNEHKGVTTVSAERRSIPLTSRRGLQDESEDELVRDAAVPEREGIEVTTEYRVGS